MFSLATTVAQSNIVGVKGLMLPETKIPTADAQTKLDQVKQLLLFQGDGVAATIIKQLLEAAQTKLDHVRRVMLFTEYGVEATTLTIGTHTTLDGIKWLL